MPFVEDPAHLCKTRPRSGLVAHGLELPPAVSGEVRVELHVRHSDHRTAAEFSSDDDLIQDVADDEDLADPKMSDLSNLTDDALKAMLLKYGVKPGPIVASTRALYERKLKKLLQSDGYGGAEDGMWYSDSEEERERHEDKESEPDDQEMIEASESQQGSREVHREPVAEILKDIFPNTKASPTGIYATPRRPIKGAAQRPIQYSYPDTPVSPVTVQERRDVQRRLVPYWIQILVFFIVMGILYLIYVNVEPSCPVLAMLESLNQWSDG
ncbi:LEM domain-containing protein 1 [Nematolebias whitei]|uniref:LEM domain-containing protein 1 n=1 Tax=Nematolebias whitei TaxID=451745 RepID=UPI00189AD288|nr:LEM domain-containing protein 1 [Nematolebias whitei]